jgi:Tol biopolymer transport system component
MKRCFRLLFVAALIVLLPARATSAQPTATTAGKIIDCFCYDIYRIRPDGSGKRLVSAGGERDLSDVSADRTRILFQHKVGVLESSTIRGRDKRILAGGAWGGARWSPDGRKIAYFRADQACRGPELHVLDADGRNDRSFGCSPFVVEWAPDSRQILFVSSEAASQTFAQFLDAAQVNGGGRHAITAATSQISSVRWSPRGDEIAYVTGSSGNQHVRLVRLDGSHDHVLVRGDAPNWSPDGRTLQFRWTPGRGRTEAAAMINPARSRIRVADPLAIDPYLQGVGWSPDGRWIVYRRRYRSSSRCGCRMALWIARRNGADKRLLTKGVDHEEFGPLYWSRDGKTILYTSYIQQGE